MVRTSKSDKQSTAPAAAAPVVEKAAAPKKVSSKKAAAAPAAEAAPAAAPAPVVEAAPTAVDTVVEAVDSSMSVKLNVFGAKLQQLAGLFSSVKSEFKVLEKSIARELKNAQKSSSRKKKATGNRAPSGFVKPTRISDELAQFLGKSVGTEMARTDVSKEINAYIRSHNLQDKTNGRKINADTKLSALLKLKNDDELTYFNLQRFMKHHFIKAEAAATA
jgi:chromatin remodeling complex protein RSC6